MLNLRDTKVEQEQPLLLDRRDKVAITLLVPHSEICKEFFLILTEESLAQMPLLIAAQQLTVSLKK